MNRNAKLTATAGFVALSVVAVGAVVLVSGSNEHGQSRAHPIALTFEPAAVRFENVHTGTYTAAVRLANRGSISVRQITLYPSCGCLHLGVDRIVDLRPGHAVRIPFALDVAFVGVTEEVIQVSVAGKPIGLSASVRASSVSPFIGQLGSRIAVGELWRGRADEAVRPVKAHVRVRPSVTDLTLTPEPAWLRANMYPSSRGYILTVGADPLAPEGPFDAPVQANYRFDGVLHTAPLYLTGAVRSHVRVEPDSLSFGVCRLSGACPPQRCTVFAKRTGPDLMATSSDARVLPVIVEQSSRSVIIEVRVAPRGVGEVHAAVRLRDRRGVLATVPVTAFLPG